MTPPSDDLTPRRNGSPGDGPPSDAGARREDDASRLAERRLLDEIARQRRRERDDIVKVRFGCLVVIAVLVVLMAVAFVFL